MKTKNKLLVAAAAMSIGFGIPYGSIFSKDKPPVEKNKEPKNKEAKNKEPKNKEAKPKSDFKPSEPLVPNWIEKDTYDKEKCLNDASCSG